MSCCGDIVVSCISSVFDASTSEGGGVECLVEEHPSGYVALDVVPSKIVYT